MPHANAQKFKLRFKPRLQYWWQALAGKAEVLTTAPPIVPNCPSCQFQTTILDGLFCCGLSPHPCLTVSSLYTTRDRVKGGLPGDAMQPSLRPEYKTTAKWKKYHQHHDPFEFQLWNEQEGRRILQRKGQTMMQPWTSGLDGHWTCDPFFFLFSFF